MDWTYWAAVGNYILIEGRMDVLRSDRGTDNVVMDSPVVQTQLNCTDIPSTQLHISILLRQVIILTLSSVLKVLKDTH